MYVHRSIPKLLFFISETRNTRTELPSKADTRKSYVRERCTERWHAGKETPALSRNPPVFHKETTKRKHHTWGVTRHEPLTGLCVSQESTMNCFTKHQSQGCVCQKKHLMSCFTPNHMCCYTSHASLASVDQTAAHVSYPTNLISIGTPSPGSDACTAAVPRAQRDLQASCQLMCTYPLACSLRRSEAGVKSNHLMCASDPKLAIGRQYKMAG